jgi:hypothetical protein
MGKRLGPDAGGSLVLERCDGTEAAVVRERQAGDSPACGEQGGPAGRDGEVAQTAAWPFAASFPVASSIVNASTLPTNSQAA